MRAPDAGGAAGAPGQPRPLEGITVLEIGSLIAGPFCGMLLGDMGADVIKIERPPGGDQTRAIPPFVSGSSVSFAALNRNKRSIVLDLKRPEVRPLVEGLVRRADVIVENNRPGALGRLGLGPDEARSINSEIVYVSVSGFGQTGPYRTRAGVNLIVEAFAGALSVTGEPDAMPMRPGIQTADLFGALYAAFGAVSALAGVARGQGGRSVDVSLAEATIAAAAWEAAGYLATGEVPQRLGHRHRLNAPYQLFETSDGEYIAIGAPNDELFRRLLTVVELDAHLADPRFATYASRKEHEDEVIALVAPAIARFEAEVLERRMLDAGVPASRVLDFEDVFDDPHVRERRVVQEVDGQRMVRNPVLLDAGGPAITRRPPLLGEHSIEILREQGVGEEMLAPLIASGAVGIHRTAASPLTLESVGV